MLMFFYDPMSMGIYMVYVDQYDYFHIRSLSISHSNYILLGVTDGNQMVMRALYAASGGENQLSYNMVKPNRIILEYIGQNGFSTGYAEEMLDGIINRASDN